MALAVTCPFCQTALRVRDEHAGKQVRCPRCSRLIQVASPEPMAETAVQEVQSTERIGSEVRLRACPHCGKQVPEEARKCRYCKNWLDEVEPAAENEPPAQYKPCPRCGGHRAERILWTPWGSFYGPALFTHVRCLKCNYKYNGKTGRPNTIAAIVFVAVPLLGIVAILGGLALYVMYLAGGGRR